MFAGSLKSSRGRDLPQQDGALPGAVRLFRGGELEQRKEGRERYTTGGRQGQKQRQPSP